MRARRTLRASAIAFASVLGLSILALAVGAPVPIVDRFVLFPRNVPVSEWRAHPEFTPFVVAARDGTPRDRNFPRPFHRLRPWPAPDVREDFAVADAVRDVHAPTLVLHGTADALIPIEEGRMVARASGARVKRFIALPGVAHDRIDYATPEGAGVAAFLAAI